MLHRDGKRYAVSSDEGFRVERTGSPLTQFVLRYLESDHVLEYPLENLGPGAVTVIRTAEIGGWLPPFLREDLSDERKQQIAARIVAVLRFLGDQAEVE